MNKKYRVALTAEERARLAQVVRTGRTAAAAQLRARILLKADGAAGGPCWSDVTIAEALEVSVATVERTRKRFVAGGLEAATGASRPRAPRSGSWMGRRRHASPPSPAVRRPPGPSAGPSRCWPTSASSCASSRRSAATRCASRSKKRDQAVAEARAEDPAAG